MTTTTINNEISAERLEILQSYVNNVYQQQLLSMAEIAFESMDDDITVTTGYIGESDKRKEVTVKVPVPTELTPRHMFLLEKGYRGCNYPLTDWGHLARFEKLGIVDRESQLGIGANSVRYQCAWMLSRLDAIMYEYQDCASLEDAIDSDGEEYGFTPEEIEVMHNLDITVDARLNTLLSQSFSDIPLACDEEDFHEEYYNTVRFLIHTARAHQTVGYLGHTNIDWPRYSDFLAKLQSDVHGIKPSTTVSDIDGLYTHTDLELSYANYATMRKDILASAAAFTFTPGVAYLPIVGDHDNNGDFYNSEDDYYCALQGERFAQ